METWFATRSNYTAHKLAAYTMGRKKVAVGSLCLTVSLALTDINLYSK